MMEKEFFENGECETLKYIRSVDAISGIQRLIVMEHMGRNIILMGESHDRPGSCNNDTGVLVNDLILEIVQNQPNLDFFLEWDYHMRNPHSEVKDLDESLAEENTMVGMEETLRYVRQKKCFRKTPESITRTFGRSLDSLSPCIICMAKMKKRGTVPSMEFPS